MAGATAATDDVIQVGPTQTTVITGTATRATDAFSTTAEQTNEITSNEHLSATFSLDCIFSVAPTTGGINLFRRALNIDGTNDAPEPSASYLHEYIGTFPVDDVTTQQYSLLADIPLLLGDQSFYISTGTDQTLGTAYVVKITQVTFNQK